MIFFFFYLKLVLRIEFHEQNWFVCISYNYIGTLTVVIFTQTLVHCTQLFTLKHITNHCYAYNFFNTWNHLIV